jgi:hypothetical protein
MSKDDSTGRKADERAQGASANSIVMRLLTPEEIDFVSGGAHTQGIGSNHTQGPGTSYSQGPATSYTQSGGGGGGGQEN